MSVTLGDLIQAANNATNTSYKSLPEPPAEDTFYGSRLPKSVQSNLGSIAKSKYTLLDEGALNPYPQEVYPMMTPPFNPNYGQMNEYNSNPTTNVNLPAPTAQQFINRQMDNGVTSINSVMQTPEGPLYLPRPVSFQNVASNYKAGMYQYGELGNVPPIAGSVPMLKNAVANDQAVAMKEGFQYGPHGRYSDDEYDCVSVLRHVRNCPLCQRYFKCDNRMYIAMIVMLVICFAVILLLLLRKNIV
jgi:hypothetical protein